MNIEVSGFKNILRGESIVFMKKQMVVDVHNREVAIETAIRVGLLKRCKCHGYVFDACKYNYEYAYRLFNYLITHNSSIMSEFNGKRNELTDLIKEVVDDYDKECPVCKSIKPV